MFFSELLTKILVKLQCTGAEKIQGKRFRFELSIGLRDEDSTVRHDKERNIWIGSSVVNVIRCIAFYYLVLWLI